MQKYLQTTVTYFIDPHGTPDNGGTTKAIVEGEEFDLQYEEQNLPENDGKYYCDGEWIDEDEFQGSEDGYNRQYECDDLRPISDEEAERFQKIIDAYEEF